MRQPYRLARIGTVEYPNLAFAEWLAQRTGVVTQAPIQLLTADGLVDVTAHQRSAGAFSQFPNRLATQVMTRPSKHVESGASWRRVRKDDVALRDPALPDIVLAPFVGKPVSLGTSTPDADDANTGHYHHQAIHVARGSLLAFIVVSGNVERRQLESADQLQCGFQRWRRRAGVATTDGCGGEIARQENCGQRSP